MMDTRAAAVNLLGKVDGCVRLQHLLFLSDVERVVAHKITDPHLCLLTIKKFCANHQPTIGELRTMYNIATLYGCRPLRLLIASMLHEIYDIAIVMSNMSHV